MEFSRIAGGGGADEAVLFFNGWGMDPAVVKRLDPEDADVWTLWDYGEGCDCPAFSWKIFEVYSQVHVVAWSLGVWVADRFLRASATGAVRFGECVAVNGTIEGIDDRYGIPVKGYVLTERGILHGGCGKFVSRMFRNPEDCRRFEACGCTRDLEGRQKELVRIREMVEEEKKEKEVRPADVPEVCGKDGWKWEKALVSSADVIFPVQNMAASWEKHGVRVVPIDSGHYPFYCFSTWRELLCR